MDETEGFPCLGTSNWTICSPLSNFCFGIFPIFSLSYWGAHSYYPRGPIMRKGNSPNSRNGSDRGVSVPGAFKLDHLQPFKPILGSRWPEQMQLKNINWTKQLNKKLTPQKASEQLNSSTFYNWTTTHWTMILLTKFSIEHVIIEQCKRVY